MQHLGLFIFSVCLFVFLFVCFVVAVVVVFLYFYFYFYGDVVICLIIHVVFIYTRSLSYYGEPPYQTGNEVCAACPQDRPYCVNNLCCK